MQSHFSGPSDPMEFVPIKTSTKGPMTIQEFAVAAHLHLGVLSLPVVQAG
jgi:hypothetical protein